MTHLNQVLLRGNHVR